MGNVQIFQTLLIFLFLDIFTITVIFKLEAKHERLASLTQQDIQEKINTLQVKLTRLNLEKSALNLKIQRYIDLSYLLESLNNVFLESPTAQILLDTAFHMVGRDKGNCILYLVAKQKQELHLFMAKKEHLEEIIHAKKGDIFEQWIMRQARPLLIVDTKNDFRFDSQIVAKSVGPREIRSLVSAPLLGADKFLGVLRLDNHNVNYYDTEDLRLLSTIADLAGVAIENVQLYEHTEDLAIRDGLTNLYLRRFFLERLTQELQRADIEGGILSLLMVDIDHFKDYNDKFGHIVGDIVLKNIAKWLNEKFMQAGNIICRFGGEEFTVLLPNTKKDKAYIIAQDFRKMVRAQKITLRRSTSAVTVSIGVATYPEDARSSDELIKQADSALYKAKESGRDKVCTI